MALIDLIIKSLPDHFDDWRKETYPWDREAIVDDIVGINDNNIASKYLEEIHNISIDDILKVEQIKNDYLDTCFYKILDKYAEEYVNYGKYSSDLVFDIWKHIDVNFLITNLRSENIAKIEICLCLILSSLINIIFAMHYAKVAKYRQQSKNVLVINYIDEYDRDKNEYLWPVLR